ncbi:hypothetical protein IWQ60_000899 [Tieghemiomyces parasiticus]|uniref:Eukaryotic translation initiation factor 2A n=1 Tax=Tieghemiomyces parasiticus TaxID=78921 RepID=A0A9W8AFM9_9FUNG|nr:hypothetical protein IWQ60_000899 [Tieghemiomyces parasiticus]
MEDLQIAYRSVKEIGLLTGPPQVQDVAGFDKPQGMLRAMKYSPDGRLFAWASNDAVHILDVAKNQTVQVLPRAGVVELDFSPQGTYLLTWERFVKPPEGPLPKNTLIWATATGEQLGAFTRKLQSSWTFQWSYNEQYCAILATNEVHFFDPTRLDRGVHLRLQLEGVSTFAFSPGRSPAVAVFVPARKSQPGHVRLYAVGQFRQPLAQKTFFKADTAQLIWNSLGTNLLVLCSTDMDSTGKSYYGETNLYYLTITGNFDCHVVLDKEGPIHDVAWNPDPDAKEFAVVYGYMPAKAALFDRRANRIHDFGTAPRNFVQFNPQGRLVAIAGFGNLTGQTDIWDLKTRTKLVTLDCSNSTTCAWAPSGRHLMTATLSPRLRVDNGIKVWHHTGSLLFHRPIHELYQTTWRPLPVQRFPDRSALSPPPRGITVESKTPTRPAVAAGAYRPPHARGTPTPASFRRDDENQRANGGATSASPAVAAAPPVYKAGTQARYIPGAAPPPGASSTPGENAVSNRLRTVTRQLKQIETLKQRQNEGATLEPEQIVKIQKEANLRAELQTLKSSKNQA